MLQDIERIEVIRGPGASTWGANAVNGVINIITKKAEDAQGGYLSGTLGDRQRGVMARYGGRLGENGHYRIHAKAHRQDPLPAVPGTTSPETDWEGARAGFRADWKAGDATDLMVQGEVYREDVSQSQPHGGYLLGRWDNRRPDGSSDKLQGYVERFDFGDWSDGENRGKVTLDIVNLEYRRQFPVFGGHNVIAGLGYRLIKSEIDAGAPTEVSKPRRHDQVFSAFAQDDIRLVANSTYLTLGLKLEHNDFTGFEVQPSARLRWLAAPGQTFWASVSRAVRSPSIGETSLTVVVPVEPASSATGGLPIVLRLRANSGFDSETVIAYELGYRWQVSSRLGLDAALFYNDYDRLADRDLALGPPRLELAPSPRLVVDGRYGNTLAGEVYGFELAGDYRPLDGWRLRAAYSFLDIQLHRKAGSTDPFAEFAEGSSPSHQFSLRSSMDLNAALELDLWARYVSALPSFDTSNYLTLDARLGWKAAKDLELSLIGRNLLDSRRREFGELSLTGSEYEAVREVYLTADWRF